MLNHLTICMAVYGQPKMLGAHLDALMNYEDEILDRLTIHIVDDCGDPPVDTRDIEVLDALAKASLWRITDDIPWNQMGARNLAMQHAMGWCLMMDPDMIFSPAMIRRAMEIAGKLKRGSVVRYGLKHVNDSSRPVDMTSPNTYLIHRDDFWMAGGYDEDYAGHKGWSDVQMLDVLGSLFRVSRRPDLHANFYSTENYSDAAVHSLDRKTAHNRKIRIDKVKQATKLGGWRKWISRRKGPTLRFNWTRAYPTS